MIATYYNNLATKKYNDLGTMIATYSMLNTKKQLPLKTFKMQLTL